MNIRQNRHLLLAVVLITMAMPCLADVYYVDWERLDNIGDGRSWAGAKRDLQEAIDEAAKSATAGAPSQVLVRAGVYKPTSHPNGGTEDRERHFSLRNNVMVYGGFVGDEISLIRRDPGANPTICRGDFNDDDVVNGSGETLTIENNTENAYHVFYHPDSANLNATAVLDGFIIEAGNANGFSDDSGGGMFGDSASCKITNCLFRHNTARLGGGMYSGKAVSPTIANCTFFANQANSGAGMLINGASAKVTNCTFNGNSAASWGGGIFVYGISSLGSSPVVTNCTISGNSAGASGGGICTEASMDLPNYPFNLSLRNSILWQNSAPNLAELSFDPNFQSTVSYCVIEGLADPVANVFDEDPMLLPLADNAGPVLTMAIERGSSAIDAGNAGFAPATDAREALRPQGDGFDIGAFESPYTTGPALEVRYVSDDNGASASDSITNDNTLSFHGTADPGAEVTVLINGNPTGEPIAADSAGDWSYDHSAVVLADGAYVLTAMASSILSPAVTVTIDTESPVLTFSTDAEAPVSGPFTVTIDANEGIWGLSAESLVISNGMISEFTGGGSQYTFTVSPSTDGNNVLISLPLGTASDIAGNQSLAAIELGPIEAVDVSPNVILATDSTSVSGAFVVTATFTESVTGFVEEGEAPTSVLNYGDILVGNGIASGFSGEGASYTFTVYPSSGGNVTVQVPAGVAVDASDQENSISNELTVSHTPAENEDFDSGCSLGTGTSSLLPMLLMLLGMGIARFRRR